jgi:hypothetical protein
MATVAAMIRVYFMAGLLGLVSLLGLDLLGHSFLAGDIARTVPTGEAEGRPWVEMDRRYLKNRILLFV